MLIELIWIRNAHPCPSVPFLAIIQYVYQGREVVNMYISCFSNLYLTSLHRRRVRRLFFSARLSGLDWLVVAGGIPALHNLGFGFLHAYAVVVSIAAHRTIPFHSILEEKKIRGSYVLWNFLNLMSPLSHLAAESVSSWLIMYDGYFLSFPFPLSRAPDKGGPRLVLVVSRPARSDGPARATFAVSLSSWASSVRAAHLRQQQEQ